MLSEEHARTGLRKSMPVGLPGHPPSLPADQVGRWPAVDCLEPAPLVQDKGFVVDRGPTRMRSRELLLVRVTATSLTREGEWPIKLTDQHLVKAASCACNCRSLMGSNCGVIKPLCRFRQALRSCWRSSRCTSVHYKGFTLRAESGRTTRRSMPML